MRYVLAALLLCLGSLACDADADADPDVTCTPGQRRCSGTGSEVCAATGDAWVVSACPESTLCRDVCEDGGACVAQCAPIICTPGVERCCVPGEDGCAPNDNATVLRCDETGTTWCAVGNCAQPPLNGVCSDGTCRTLCGDGNKTYKGCEFYAADLDNAVDHGDGVTLDADAGPYAVVVSNATSGQLAFVHITSAPLVATPFPEDACNPPPPEDPSLVAAAAIPPRGLKVFNLPRRDVTGTTIELRAYRITSNVEVTVYQFNPLDNVNPVFSNDASLLLPTSAVGNDYLVMNREQITNSFRSYVTIIGTQPDTVVTVTPTAPTLPGTDMRTGAALPGLQPGEPLVATLGRYEILNVTALLIDNNLTDLTGTRVTADKPVVVYSGHEAANVPFVEPHVCCADHLEQQLYPISAWGTSYVAVKSFPRGSTQPGVDEPDVWRILAAGDNTLVTLTPAVATVPVLNAGEFYELQTSEDFLIEADKPILVGQFFVGSTMTQRRADGEANGDPSFMLGVPIRQALTDYVFLAPDAYEKDYVAVAAPEGSVVLLDGSDIEAESGVRVNPIAGTLWRAIRVPIADGFHTLSCGAVPNPDDPGEAFACSVMVHGYDDDVSYGYPGGLKLQDAAP